MAITRNCPSCGSAETRRSRRRPIEHLLLHMRPFRCSQCERRFFSFLRPDERVAEAAKLARHRASA